MAETGGLTSDRIYLRNQNFLSYACPDIPTDHFAITLRKQKRQSLYLKKRLKSFQASTPPTPLNPTRELLQSFKPILQSTCSPPELLQVLQYLRSQFLPNNTLVLKLAKSLNMIPDLTSLLKSFHHSSAEFKETLGCICNLASGPGYLNEELLMCEVDILCMHLLNNDDEDVVETAIWCLSNMGADNLKCRQKLVQLGTLQVLTEKLKNSAKMQNTLIWAIRNLIEGLNELPEAIILSLLKAIRPLLKKKSQSVYIETLWIFSLLSDGKENQIERLVKSKCLGLVLAAVQSNGSKIVTPAIRAIGNISAGSSKHSQILLDKGVLDLVYGMIDRFACKFKVKKYIFWCLSNLTSGIRSQIEIIVKHPVLIKVVIAINDFDNRIRKEAITVVVNIIKLGSLESIRALVNVGIIKEVKRFLQESLDFDLIFVVLEAVLGILENFKGGWQAEAVSIVRSCGVVEQVERLVQGKNEKVQKVAERVLEFLETAEFREI